jgi:hypothetical protein
MRAIQLASICLMMLIVHSCKNDLEINAPWRETPVVYAFIDPNTNTQYFRIQKTYQNSIDLTTAEGAQIADSLYFDTLNVKVTQGNKTYSFYRTANMPKDDGFFSSGAHFLYECKGFTGLVDKDYTLTIYSPKTGNSYFSTTRCVGATKITAAKLNFNADNEFSISTVKSSISSGSAALSQIMRLVYIEYPVGTTQYDTLNADFTLNPNEQTYNPVTQNFLIQNSVFTNAIKNLIPDKGNAYERQVVGIDFINVGGAKELADLIELNEPSASIVQKKVDYSNISDGLGIFSSRSYKHDVNIQSFDAANWPTQKQNLVNALNAVDKTGIVVKNLHFVL